MQHLHNIADTGCVQVDMQADTHSLLSEHKKRVLSNNDATFSLEGLGCKLK